MGFFVLFFGFVFFFGLYKELCVCEWGGECVAVLFSKCGCLVRASQSNA